MSIAEIRQKYPQYNDMSDGDLLLGLHKSRYSDMHIKDFMAKVDPGDNARLTISDKMWPYWKEKVSVPMEGERGYERDKRIGGDVRLPPGDDAETAARSGVQGYTFGAGDNIVGGGAALLHSAMRDDGRSLGNLYQGYRGQAQEQLERGRDENPYVAYPAEVAGAVLSPINKLLPGGRAQSTAGRVGEGALAGSIGGTVYGGLEDESVMGAMEGGAFGALAGGALPLMLRPFQGAGTESVRRFADRAPTLDDLRGQADALFAQGDNAVMPRAGLTQAAPSIAGQAARQGMDEMLTPQSARAVSRIADEAANVDPNISFRDLDILRRQAQVPASNMQNRTESAIGSQLVDQIDDIIEQSDPALGGAISKARDLWGRMRRTEQINKAIASAEDTASGYENGLRIEFRKILKDPKKRRGFSPDEIAAMERVSRGTAVSNILRQVGRFGFNLTGKNFTNTLTPTAGAVGASMVSPYLAAAVPMVGTAAQTASHQLAKRNADLIRAMVASGQVPAQVQGRLSRMLAPAPVGNMATDLLPIGAQPLNPLRDTLPRRQR